MNIRRLNLYDFFSRSIYITLTYICSHSLSLSLSFVHFQFVAESESTAEPGAIQDILTCGSCQKTFALGDIVKFIQHKVLQCNKENYGQCFPQGE